MHLATIPTRKPHRQLTHEMFFQLKCDKDSGCCFLSLSIILNLDRWSFWMENHIRVQNRIKKCTISQRKITLSTIKLKVTSNKRRGELVVCEVYRVSRWCRQITSPSDFSSDHAKTTALLCWCFHNFNFNEPNLVREERLQNDLHVWDDHFNGRHFTLKSNLRIFFSKYPINDH